MRRSIVVPIVLSSWSLMATLTGCASLTQQCATALLESMAQVCVDVVTAVENPQLGQASVEELVFRLSRHGFAGAVELAGNRP